MSPFRVPTLTVAIALAGLTACGEAQTQAVEARAAVDEAEETLRSAPTVDGEAADLDRQLAELGWAGAAASTYAYAEACGADAARLTRFKQAQREQAATMGGDAGSFDSEFPVAIKLAERRVEIDDVGMAVPHRADTCETVLSYLE